MTSPAGGAEDLPVRGAAATLVQAGPPAAVAAGTVRAWTVGGGGLVVTARVGTTPEAVALLGGGPVWVSTRTDAGRLVVLSASARPIPGRHDELVLTGGTDLVHGVRRAAVRAPLDRPAVLLTEAGPHPARALDLSRSGCRLRVAPDDARLALDDRVRLEVDLPAGAPLRALGRVLRVDVELRLLAVHFEGLSASDGERVDVAVFHALGRP